MAKKVWVGYGGMALDKKFVFASRGWDGKGLRGNSRLG